MKNDQPAEAAAPAPAKAPIAAPVAAEKAPAAAPAAAPAKKKKKTGLIIGIIIAILALAGAGVAVFFLFFNKTAAPEDAVVNTIEAIVNGNEGIGFSGNVKSNGYEFPVSGKIAKDAAEVNVSIDLAKISTGSMPLSGTINAKGIYKDNKVFVQVSGIKDALGTYASVLGNYLTFDGQWYGFTIEELLAMIPSASISTKCYTGISSDEFVNAFLGAYKDNIFIVTSKYEGNEITKKSSDVYSLTIDNEKSEAFKKALENNEKYNEIKGCLNSGNTYLQSNATLGGTLDSSLDESLIVSQPASVYAEFGGNKISRFVAKSSQAEFDFDITYGSFNIEAPAGTVKSSSELMQALAPFFGGSSFTPNFNYQTPSNYDFDPDLDDNDLDLDDYDFDFDLEDYDIDLDGIDGSLTGLSSEDINTILNLYNKYGNSDVESWDAADVQTVLDIIQKQNN